MMIESLNAHQIDRIVELGAWRDEGRRFSVGIHGEVFKHHDDEKEYQDGPRQRQGAAASAPPAASPASAASYSQPTGKDRRKALRAQYAKHLRGVKEYYPSVISRELDDGIWVIAQSYPLGRDGPGFWICLFLPYTDLFDPTAFAFWEISPVPWPIGPRHTNYPDASICAFIPADDAWRPGDSPLILLNLYAEWIICQLFSARERKWPGAQFGMDAVYRTAEFGPNDWCSCDSGRRYVDCHLGPDRVEVQLLKLRGEYRELSSRAVPSAVTRFAKSKWRRVPTSCELHLHAYEGLPPRHLG